jgi:hypothetical protein
MRSSLLVAAAASLGFAAIVMVTRPAPAFPPAAEIRQLIDKLGSGSFSEREEATAALESAGEPALAGLRAATNSDDAEVRRRATELVLKIEQRLETDRLLVPTKVKLSLKNAPLIEAVGELCKQSGYTVSLQDPKGVLHDRKITLNTGEVTFWEALEKLCVKGHLIEESMVPPTVTVASGGFPAPAVPGAPVPLPPGAIPGGRIAMIRPVPTVGHLTLLDGTHAEMPSAYVGSVRVRALRTPAAERADTGHFFMNLLVTTEPKVHCQDNFTLRLDKAMDDEGQSLSLADEPLPEPVFNGRRFGVQPGVGFSVQYLQTRLNPGLKPAKSLREVRGSLCSRLATEPRPLVAVEDVLKNSGKTVRGIDGAAIKVIEAKRIDRTRMSVRFELELTPDQAAVAVLPAVSPRRPGGVRAGGVPVAMAPAPVTASGAAGANNRGGLQLFDNQGNAIQSYSWQSSFRRDPKGIVREYAFEFALPADRTAKLLYSGGKAVPVEIPFVLRDIPLP